MSIYNECIYITLHLIFIEFGWNLFSSERESYPSRYVYLLK